MFGRGSELRGCSREHNEVQFSSVEFTLKAPTAKVLLTNEGVRQTLEEAWSNSLSTESDLRHEEGGWIYFNSRTGDILTRRARPGLEASLDLGSPPIVADHFVVATFHTHPNPSAEGWYPGPSLDDTESAWEFGIPCIIRSDDDIYITGPESRRGALKGNPGFPR
jgi:hypothetical protein